MVGTALAVGTAVAQNQNFDNVQIDTVKVRDNVYGPGDFLHEANGMVHGATEALEDTEYLFFVAKDERRHVFSKTIEEHRRWVEKYMK